MLNHLDANEEPSLIPEYLKRGVETLVPILKMWIESNKKSTEETQKPIFKSFYRTLRHLEKEVRKQRQIENRHSSCSPIRLSEEDEDDCHSPVKITIKCRILCRFYVALSRPFSVRLQKAKETAGEKALLRHQSSTAGGRR